MAKTSGLGDNFYFHNRNLSGDVGSLGTIGGGPALLEMTAINKSAYERQGGLRNGIIEFTTFFNNASLQEHSILSTLATTDRILTYTRGTTLGNSAASMVAKQINYDGTRGADGSFTLNVQGQANAYGLEWGRLLTAGVRTDTGATDGASIDTTASASFGAQAYLNGMSFAGTDVTVKIQDSANDSVWADVAGFTFTQLTASGSERLALSNTATVRRYLRAVTITTGGFTNFQFAVMVVKNEAAGVVF